jgi:hypothetical protein
MISITFSHEAVLARSSHEFIHAPLTKPSKGVPALPWNAGLSERFVQSVFSRVYSRASYENQGASEEALEKIAFHDFLSRADLFDAECRFPTHETSKNIHPLLA